MSEDDPAVVGLSLVNARGHNCGQITLLGRDGVLREEELVLSILRTSKVCLQMFGEVLAWEANGQSHMCLLMSAAMVKTSHSAEK